MREIVAQDGDYVPDAKANQKQLSEEIEAFLDEAQGLDFNGLAEQKGIWFAKDPGRLETRRETLVGDVSSMGPSMCQNGKNLAAVGMIKSEQEVKGRVGRGRRCAIVSAGVQTVAQFAYTDRVLWVWSARTGFSTSFLVMRLTSPHELRGTQSLHPAKIRPLCLV